ncbi:MAG: rhodanese-like domain-containing protein, partial [Nitrosopumilus sp.]|nr:rhodanese-like domain-containing protein [Nitrosopumilus sp.]
MNKDLSISSEQLVDDLNQQKPLLMFDLRTRDDFLKSHVEGSAHAVCDTQAKQQIMPKIPKNIKIVLISEPDEFSKETAEMMSSM